MYELIFSFKSKKILKVYKIQQRYIYCHKLIFARYTL